MDGSLLSGAPGSGLGAATTGSARDVVADGAGVAACVADDGVVVEGPEQTTVRTQRRGGAR